jgi:CubicO group peptidase (beta-lactamase class C family)
MRLDLVDALRLASGKIQEICKISGVAGLSLAVIDHGETVYKDNFGYRDLAKQDPVTSDTIFQIASMTKSFTGVCLNQLRAQGRLTFDDLICKHLPEARSQDSMVGASGTIADLLGHRTGLQNADSIWLGAEGELLIDREQTVAVFSQLQPKSSLRSRFLYNNFGYAMLGEIIIKLTGQPYHSYLKENVLSRLNMTRTLVTKDDGLPEDTSLAYSTLDDGTPQNVPLPGSSASIAMGSAGGLLSSSNDLAKYYKALMKVWRSHAQSDKDDHDVEDATAIFGDVSWLFAPLQIMEVPAFREKSYAAGWARSQLPTTVGDIGVNPSLVEEMPLLAEGIDSRLAFWHQGSLVGATSFVMLLPETESAVIVLTNTMALNDAADWVGQFLVETLLDSPVRHDFIHLASVSASRSLQKYAELTEKVEEGRQSGGPPRDLNKYVGTYVGFGGLFHIEVAENEGELAILFQGRQSDKYALRHHHDDTFTWFMSWNEQIRRGRFPSFGPALYSVRFEGREGSDMTCVNWVFDASMPDGQDFVRVPSDTVSKDTKTKL